MLSPLCALFCCDRVCSATPAFLNKKHVKFDQGLDVLTYFSQGDRGQNVERPMSTSKPRKCQKQVGKSRKIFLQIPFKRALLLNQLFKKKSVLPALFCSDLSLFSFFCGLSYSLLCKFGFYVKNPAQNRLETSQIRNLDQKAAKLFFKSVFLNPIIRLVSQFYWDTAIPLYSSIGTEKYSSTVLLAVRNRVYRSEGD